MDDRLGAELAQVLHEVVDERVVVVDDEDPGASPIETHDSETTRAVANLGAEMAPPKRRSGGRVTAKGTPAGSKPVPRATTAPSGRYTPPVPKAVKVSPPWVPILMFVLLGIGAAMIMLNYLEVLPGAASNWYLVGGLAFILGGIATATQYR